MWHQARPRLGPPLEALEEPPISSDRVVRFRGRRISYDLASAALELATIAEVLPEDRLTTARTIELGGGYGRRAWAMLSMHRKARYVIVDAAPSLALAQLYLAETLPPRRVFHFRAFDDPDRVIDELLTSEIAFLTPNQLSLLPGIGAELWLSICSLEGHSYQQVEAHFGEVDRHVRGWAYSKQARISASPTDGVALEQTDYPYPARWKRVLERPATLQRSTFEAVFEIPEPSA
jgi:putative sugar O-methyltransferase